MELACGRIGKETSLSIPLVEISDFLLREENARNTWASFETRKRRIVSVHMDSTTWLFELRYELFGRHLSIAGIAGFFFTLSVGVLASMLVQIESFRQYLTRRGLDKNFIALATGLTGLGLVILSFFVGLHVAGVPIDSEIPVPGMGISIGRLLRLAILLLAVFWFGSMFKRVLFNRYLSKMGMDRALQYTVAQLSGYVILVVGTFIVVQNAGVDLSPLAVFAGAIGVGIGLGLQKLTSNFISGLVVLAERPIKIGDRIEVNKVAGQVTAIRARSTTVLTNDNIAIIVPNSDFIEHAVINWTHDDPNVRIRLPVPVAYGSDAAQVEKVLLEVARENPAVLNDPAPVVFFDGFGDNALNFELGVWTAELSSRPRRFRSDLNYAIDRALRKAGIALPSPARELYIQRLPESVQDA